MEHPEEHYYKLNRFFLSISGLWPYQSKWSACLMRAILTVVMLSSTIFQISSFFTFDVNAEFIVDVIPALIPTLGSLSHMYARVRNIDKLRILLERMWNDWSLQKTNYEIKIMHEHAETTRLVTVCYSFLMYAAVIIYIIWIFVPEILDVIAPMNESRPRIQPFKVEFFIDEEQYFYLIRSHICIVLFLLPIIFISSVTLYIALTQHVCGMCELLGFIDIIEIYHTIPFLMDFLGFVLAMGLALAQILTIGGNIERAFRSIGFTFATMMYLFISNYMGQKITDKTSNICERVYNSIWYDAVVSEQKLLLLIMKRRFYPLVLTVCKLYVISLQNFGMILQTAMSYCMFMRQT